MNGLLIGLGIFATVCEVAGLVYLYRIWRDE